MAVFLTKQQLVTMGVMQQINITLAGTGLVAVQSGAAILIQDITSDPNLLSKLRTPVDRSLSANFTDQRRMAVRKALGVRIPVAR